MLQNAVIMLLPNGEKAVLAMMTATDITIDILKKVSRAIYDSLIVL